MMMRALLLRSAVVEFTIYPKILNIIVLLLRNQSSHGALKLRDMVVQERVVAVKQASVMAMV